jgi:hypothetical protein
MKEDSRTRLLLVACGISLPLVLLTFVALWFLQLTAIGPYRDTYSAYVLEKPAVRLESSDGGASERVLIVGDLNGNHFKIKVSEKIYQQAEPGMFIEKKALDTDPFLGR